MSVTTSNQPHPADAYASLRPYEDEASARMRIRKLWERALTGDASALQDLLHQVEERAFQDAAREEL